MCIFCSELAGRRVAAGLTGFADTRLTRDQIAVIDRLQRPVALPRREEFVITNAYVMPMEPGVDDIPEGAVHVRDGEIVAVGKDVQADGVTRFDGTGMIVMPGLVDTHWHLWHSLLRCLRGDKPEVGFFPTITRFSTVMEPDDMYASALIGLAEGLNSGVTTVHSWCHNIRSRAHAEGDLRAVREVGVRGLWSFGQAIAQPDNTEMRLDDLRAMHADWSDYANDGLIEMGMAWRGMFRNEWIPEGIYRKEFDTGRDLGLPVSVHIGTLTSRTGHLKAHYEANLLGPDVNVVHCCSATAEEIDMIKETGASMSLLPLSETKGGWGFPLLGECLDKGVPTSIGVDSTAITGTANLFANLNMAMCIDNVRAGSEYKLTARRVLELATMDAAAVLGMADRIGSLKPGKRADLIMIDTNQLNMGMFTDPAKMVVECTQPANVDTVVVDGRVLKRDGELTHLDPGAVIDTARMSLAEVRQRADWI